MIYLLDSNVCITLLRADSAPASGARGRAALRAAVIRRRHDEADALGHEVCSCSVVRYELLTGAEKSDRPEHNAAKVHSLLAAFRSFPFDTRAADDAARIRAHVETRGTPIGPSDLLIAAIARANGLTLVTANTAEFARVPGLAIIDWSAA